MVWRKVLAMLLVVVAASPAWGATEPLGSIATANAATVRDTNLSEGSTVFSGDVISVAANGSTRIALNGGAQVEVLANSSVRLTKTDEKIQMRIDRGQASFHFSGNSGVSALVADATVRPSNSGETSAVIESYSDTHAIVAAERGSLLVTTAHDGKTYTINEGEAADLSATTEPQQNGGAVPAGRSAPAIGAPSKTVVIWTVAIVGAGAVAASVMLVRREHRPSNTSLGNEISPSKIN
jgi:FecR protein